jgi:hypothetical protein
MNDLPPSLGHDQPMMIAQGGLRDLKEHVAVLAAAGIAAQIVCPPGSGKG